MDIFADGTSQFSAFQDNESSEVDIERQSTAQMSG